MPVASSSLTKLKYHLNLKGIELRKKQPTNNNDISVLYQLHFMCRISSITKNNLYKKLTQKSCVIFFFKDIANKAMLLSLYLKLRNRLF